MNLVVIFSLNSFKTRLLQHTCRVLKSNIKAECAETRVFGIISKATTGTHNLLMISSRTFIHHSRSFTERKTVKIVSTISTENICIFALSTLLWYAKFVRY